ELTVKAARRGLEGRAVTIPDGVAALFSCGRGQFSFETDELKHGVFFHYVIEALKGGAKNKDGEVTWDGLGLYVRREVSRNVEKLVGGGAAQTPALLSNIEGESPVLLAAGGAAREPKPGEYEAHAGAVRSLAISPDGKLLASAGGDGVIRLWELPS